MGALSNIDITNELGENIYIYPVYSQNIKGASINLTPSEFAWSIKTKQIVYDKNTKKIIIPPNDTVLVETKEVIYVSEKLSGAYNSKVRWVSKGLGHISTTLDPTYIGPSLITLTNTTEHEIIIKSDDTIVTLSLEYLGTPTNKSNSNSAGHLEILNGYEKFDEIDRYLDQEWCKNPNELLEKMNECRDYHDICRKKATIQKQSWGHRKKYLYAYGLLIIIVLIILMVEHWIERKFLSPKGDLIIFNWIMYVGGSGIVGSGLISICKYVNNKINGGIE